MLRCSNVEKPVMPKTHPKVREKLDSCYVGLCTDWIAYKRDTGLSDSEFNAMEGDSPVIEHNDTWYNKLQEDYYDLCEKSDNVLEMQQAELSSGKVEAETKVEPEELKLRQNKKQADLMLDQIEAEVSQIEKSVKSLEIEVKDISLGSLKPIKAAAFISKIGDISHMLTVGVEEKFLKCLPFLE